MREMFNQCKNFGCNRRSTVITVTGGGLNLNASRRAIYRVVDMYYLFYECESLEYESTNLDWTNTWFNDDRITRLFNKLIGLRLGDGSQRMDPTKDSLIFALQQYWTDWKYYSKSQSHTDHWKVFQYLLCQSNLWTNSRRD